MARTYDGSRRAEAARRTREQILEAAFRLHGEGNLDIDVLAMQANVSVPTVRRHFPNREALFESCTDYGMHLVPMPDIAAIARLEDIAERVRRAVREVYALHEALLGQAWTAFKLEQESPAFAATLSGIEDTVREVADALLDPVPGIDGDDPALPGLVVGMLSPLTYRGLRVHGGLSPAEAIAQTTLLLVATLSSRVPRRGAAHS